MIWVFGLSVAGFLVFSFVYNPGGKVLQPYEGPPHIEYHPNGEVWYSGHFLNGKPDGIWRYFNEEGVLMYENEFDYGQWVALTAFVDGSRDFKAYYENNKVVKIDVYEGTRVTQHITDSTAIDSVLIKSGLLKPKTP